MSTTIELGDLSPRDIGHTVTISHRGTTITGTLNDIRVDTDWITDERINQHPDEVERVAGRKTVSVTVGMWSSDRLPLGAAVEVER